MAVKIYRPHLVKAREIAKNMLVAIAPPEAKLCRHDFIAFRSYVCNHESFPHHLDWERTLNTGIDSKCLFGIAGDHTLILSPRGSTKSTFLVEWAAWVIGMMTAPEIKLDIKILYVSYTIDVAILKSVEIKQVIESEKYQLVFPWVRPGEKWADKLWNIDRKHAGLSLTTEPYTLACSGLKGVATGKRCLTGDTLILSSFGYVEIAKLRYLLGIKVASFDTTTGQVIYKPVVAFCDRIEDGITAVKTSNGNIIHCTFDHPFYVDGGYKDASNLVVGDRALQFDPMAKTLLIDTIESITPIPGETTVYDIEVADSHCFFANDILVGNSHLILLDDLIKSPEQIESRSIREKMERNWYNVIRPTMFEGARAICLGTRMQATDIYATQFTEEKGWVQKIQKAILQGNGEEVSYWEEGQSLAHLLKLREDDPVSFSFQFNNEIVRVSEQSIAPEWIKSEDCPDIEEMEYLVLGVDLSASLRERADYTVMVLGGRLNNKYYLLDMRRCRSIGNLDKLDEILDIWEEWGQPRIDIWVEANAYQSSFKGDFTTYVVGDRKIYDLSCSPIAVKSDKLSRLRGVSGLFQHGKVAFNKTSNFGRLKEELINWGSCDHDDCADATILCLTGLRARQPLTSATIG
jgi:phage terminase large subunit-like protein